MPTNVPPFIPDQNVYCLAPPGSGQSLKYRVFNFDDGDKSSWTGILRRHELLADLNIKRLCIIESGGMGKSILLEQIEYVTQQVHPGHLVLRLDLDEIPESCSAFRMIYQERENHAGVPPLLVELIENKTDEMLRNFRDGSRVGLPIEDREARREMLQNWLLGYVRRGDFTLIVDALEKPTTRDLRNRIRQTLKPFISRLPEVSDECRFIFAGRPYTISEIWEELGLEETDAAGNPAWTFCRVQPFSIEQDETGRPSQAERYLGTEKWKAIQNLESEEFALPRSLEVIHQLDVADARAIQNPSQLYQHVLYQTLSRSIGKKVKNELQIPVLDLMAVLGAMALGMMLFPVDAEDPDAEDPDPVATSPDDAFGPVVCVSNSDQTPEAVDQFFEHLERLGILARLSHGSDRLPPVDWKGVLLKISRMGLNDLRLFVHRNEEDSPETIDRTGLITRLEFSDETVRDFYAAYFATRYFDLKIDYSCRSDDGEEVKASFPDRVLDLLARRPSKVYSHPYSKSIYPEFDRFWKFAAEMPQRSLRMEGQNSNRITIARNIGYVRALRPLFARTDLPRPTELMYRCWINLLARSEWKLPATDQGDFGVQTASRIARTKVHSLVRERRETHSADAHRLARQPVNQLIFDFLSESPLFELGESRAESNQELDAMFVEFPVPGSLLTRCGHSKDPRNRERYVPLVKSFRLSRLAVTNRVYAWFDRAHGQHFEDDVDYFRDPDQPVIHTTFYDASMCAIFLDSRLPTEWEWEHACRRNGVDDRRGQNSKRYFAVDDESRVLELLDPHTWHNRNSGYKPHPVGEGEPSPCGLVNMLGNVWEWCDSRIKPHDANLVYRGGAFTSNPEDITCASRIDSKPAFTNIDLGFRLAR